MDLRLAYLEMRRAGEADFPPACLDYLYRLVYRLAAGGRQVPPARLCRAFARAARADFGDFAPSVASVWGLAEGADLGRAVHRLAKHRCLTLGAGETLEEYAAAGSLGLA